jgi:hypothetical protein
MKSKNQNQEEIDDNLDFLNHLIQTKTELWQYHPLNKDFINPILAYNKVIELIKEIDDKIWSLKRDVTALN